MRPAIALLLLLVIAATPASAAKDVEIGMGNFAPYYVPETEGGIFTDIVEAVFAGIDGYQPKYLFDRSNKRLWRDYADGRLHAISNLFDSVDLDICRTDPTFRFHDVAISRRADNLAINRITDLSDKRVVTFQGAQEFFGHEFANLVNFKSYLEMAAQEKQAEMLVRGRADVNVGDLFIFLNGLRKISGPPADPNSFAVHEIFPQIWSRMGFRDPILCALFDTSLKELKASGEFERIYDRYLRVLGYTR